MIKVENILIKPNFNDDDILFEIVNKLNVNKESIISFEIIKQSIDARHKPNVKYVLSVGVNLKNNLEENFKDKKYEPDNSLLSFETVKLAYRPIVIGFGPSGMFAGLCLSRMGLNPIIIEQGKRVDERKQDVLDFWNNKKLNVYSNVQFGEGGAGTFSDGKLNTNLNNIYCKKVINEFCHFGAPKEISYTTKPHIGSDNLALVVKNMRNEILRNGGEFLFSHKLVDIHIVDKSLDEIVINDIVSGNKITLKTKSLFLAVGHSARDTFKLLYEKGVLMNQKPFAMGVRIEQSQDDINISQYGENYNKCLPSADYKLVEHLKNGRSVFTFCMCPGGQVISCSTNNFEIVTNGMSNFKRDLKNANSAILVNVLTSDYDSNSPLAGIEFQSKYEQMAYRLGGGDFTAPAQTVGEFLSNSNRLLPITSTYRPNIKNVNLKDCLPTFVFESIKSALPLFNNKIKNFAKDNNLLIAIESRSSCPLQIIRDESFSSNIKGIIPIGEGSGHSGGIMSSAIDGIKASIVFYNLIKNK